MNEQPRPQGFALTHRDLAIFQSLSTARYLTAEALEWLHVPTWRERWDKWKEQQGGPHKPFMPISKLYHRLRQLEATNLILHIRRPIRLSLGEERRAPDLYALSPEGAAVLAEQTSIDIGDIFHEERRIRSPQTLSHSADIGRVYAALRSKIESTTYLKMLDWEGDHLTARSYDRLMVTLPMVGGGKRKVQVGLQPDATFRLLYEGGELRCFVELDRGRSTKSWREKIYAYRAYQGTRELKDRYGADYSMLLTVTTNENQRRKLMAATAEVIETPSDFYLFSLLDEVHPTTIGTCWQKIGAVIPEQQRTVGGGVRKKVRIDTASHTFIE